MSQNNQVYPKSADNNDHEQLILQVQLGDKKAFNQLMSMYHRRVFNIAFRIFGDYHIADEVAQDVFVNVYRSIKTFRFQSKFMSWLYRITVNLCRNELKRKQRQSAKNISLDASLENSKGGIIQNQLADDRLAADKSLLDNELSNIIQCGLNTLDIDFREIIILRDIQQLSYEEISVILNINIGTVRSRLHRARSMLAGRLEEVI